MGEEAIWNTALDIPVDNPTALGLAVSRAGPAMQVRLDDLLRPDLVCRVYDSGNPKEAAHDLLAANAIEPSAVDLHYNGDTLLVDYCGVAVNHSY